MADREHEFLGKTPALQPAVDRSAEKTEASVIQHVQRDPLDQVTCRAGDKSCAMAHASALNRSTDSQPGRAGRSLLQLQRQYGNRYVERVIALAKSAEHSAHSEVAPDVEREIQTQRGGGQQLDAGVRRQMEGSFGADFSGVRVHTGEKADSLNRSLSARAFTTGKDIFFRQDAYSPGTSVGRELLAHELTHVVQQNGPEVRTKLTVSEPGDVHEREADQTARAVMLEEQRPAQGVSRQAGDEKKEEQPMQAKADPGALHKQPEATKDEEERKKALHAKLDRSSVSRQTEEPEQPGA